MLLYVVTFVIGVLLTHSEPVGGGGGGNGPVVIPHRMAKGKGRQN
jgi:hypothetical protein